MTGSRSEKARREERAIRTASILDQKIDGIWRQSPRYMTSYEVAFPVRGSFEKARENRVATGRLVGSFWSLNVGLDRNVHGCPCRVAMPGSALFVRALHFA